MGCNNSSNQVTPYEANSSANNTTTNTKSNTKSSFDLQKYRLMILKNTNKYRAMHHAPPLEEDPKLDMDAQAYADEMARTGNFAHAPANVRNGAGENLFSSSYTSVDEKILEDLCQECPQCYYDEVKDYDFGNPGFAMTTGHFTQLVWNSSKKHGVGIAVGKNGVFIVNRYFPAGNMMGAFDTNVLPK
jgi:hypothetical protein